MKWPKGFCILSMSRGYHGSDQADIDFAVKHIKSLGLTNEDCAIRRNEDSVNVWTKREINFE